jgi:septal ring factor EnvC (AmiA/AmiB activator)
MRFLRLVSIFVAFALVASAISTAGPLALAQSVDEAETDAADARRRAEVADGLVDEAVAEREELEVQLAETISKVSDLSADLSVVGSALDRTAAQLGFADVELAGIESAIEVQAVDAYMTVLASPSVSVVNSPSVEQAMVVSSFVEDVVASGRASVDSLVIKRRNLETLQQQFLAEQAEFQELQNELNDELAHLAELYDQADAEVADAVRQAQAADAEYRAALSAVDLARAREAERQRQEARAPSTTTTTSPTTPTSEGGTTTTTTTQPTTTTTSGGGGGPWNHPPAVEQWRPLVETYFPANRVEEALRILDCESNGDPDAYNPYSGASGLFQFLPSTWESTAPKAGFPNASPFEPEPNVASAAWLANRYQELGLYYWQAWSCRRVL